MSYDVPTSKKWYLDLVYPLADKVERAQRESYDTARHLFDIEGNLAGGKGSCFERWLRRGVVFEETASSPGRADRRFEGPL